MKSCRNTVWWLAAVAVVVVVAVVAPIDAFLPISKTVKATTTTTTITASSSSVQIKTRSTKKWLSSTTAWMNTNGWSVAFGNEDESDSARKRKAREGAKQFILSIMNGEVEAIDDSDGKMTVVRNVFKLETGKTRPIITRSITIPFWQACIDAANLEGERVAAVGSPGIGKTTSTPFLIRMLLEQEQTVVYLFRSVKETRWYYEFIPAASEPVERNEAPKRKVIVNLYPEALPPMEISSLTLPTSYYIVDPGRTEDDCIPDDDFVPKVIIVPSPMSGHWGGSNFLKNRDGVRGQFRYYPTWSYEELILARPILREDMSVEEVGDRFRMFGGIPRRIFETKIDDLLVAQDGAIAQISSPDKVKRIALGNMDSVDRFSAQTKSAVMAIRLSDDDEGTFEKAELYIVSDIVVEKICLEYKGDLWSLMIDLGPNGGGGAMFEMITRQLMANETPPKSYYCRPCVGREDREYTNISQKTLGTGSGDISHVVDPIQAAKNKAKVVFHPISPTNKLFDFVYKDAAGHFHAFQATVADTHTANAEHIKELEEKVGGARNLSFYYLVPSAKFPSFVTKHVNPAKDGVSCDVYHVSIPNPNLNQTRTNDRGMDAPQAETNEEETESGKKRSATDAEAVAETEGRSTATDAATDEEGDVRPKKMKKESAKVPRPKRARKSVKSDKKAK